MLLGGANPPLRYASSESVRAFARVKFCYVARRAVERPGRGVAMRGCRPAGIRRLRHLHVDVCEKREWG